MIIRFDLLFGNFCSELKPELLIIACDVFLYFVHTNGIMKIPSWVRSLS